jgi:hypothetical protein
MMRTLKWANDAHWSEWYAGKEQREETPFTGERETKWGNTHTRRAVLPMWPGVEVVAVTFGSTW